MTVRLYPRGWQSRAVATLAATGMLLAAGPARAGARRIDPTRFTQQATLSDQSGVAGDDLGQSVAMSADGNTAVVGAIAYGTFNTNPGSVSIFTRAGAAWSASAKLVPSDQTRDAYFGCKVAISADGNTVLVGAYAAFSAAGAAYVFQRTSAGWIQEAELRGSDAVPQFEFGSSVALTADGGTALIGAPVADSQRGAAYVFQRTAAGWVQRQKLSASDANIRDYFGSSVASSSDGATFLVSAPSRSNHAGAVYVFTGSGSAWIERAILTASDALSQDAFGHSVALSADGTTALVGEPSYPGFPNPQAAYVFTGSGSSWTQQAELRAGVPTDSFGASVALDAAGDVGLVGNLLETGTVGKAFLFVRSGSGWSPATPIALTSSSSDSLPGESAALDAAGDRAVLGAPFDRNGAGAAYIAGLPLTATTLSSNVDPALVGTTVTYTAAVSPAPPDGTVSFWDAGALIPGCVARPVDATTGAATCTVSYGAPGVHRVKACYAGGADLAGSTSAPWTERVGYQISILSPRAGSLVSPLGELFVQFTLSDARGPLSGAAAQPLSDACEAQVSLSGGPSGICAIYDPSTGNFEADVGSVPFTSGTVTVTASLLSGGVPVSTASVDLYSRGTHGPPH